MFKKQGPQQPQRMPRPRGPPVTQVLAMRQQGLSNNQITQNLQRDGFELHEIFDAMTQADLKGGMEKVPLEKGDNMPNMGMQAPPGMPPPRQFPFQQNQQDMQMPQGPQGPMQMPQHMMPPSGMPPPDMGMETSGSRERIEEIAEAIVDEKWNELIKSVEKIIEWKERTDARLAQMEQLLQDLKGNFDKLHTAVLEKVGEYDKNLTEVGTEIKAMEKVFQKIIPTMTENVNELARISKDLKTKR